MRQTQGFFLFCHVINQTHFINKIYEFIYPDLSNVMSFGGVFTPNCYDCIYSAVNGDISGGWIDQVAHSYSMLLTCCSPKHCVVSYQAGNTWLFFLVIE